MYCSKGCGRSFTDGDAKLRHERYDDCMASRRSDDGDSIATSVAAAVSSFSAFDSPSSSSFDSGSSDFGGFGGGDSGGGGASGDF